MVRAPKKLLLYCTYCTVYVLPANPKVIGKRKKSLSSKVYTLLNVGLKEITRKACDFLMKTFTAV